MRCCIYVLKWYRAESMSSRYRDALLLFLFMCGNSALHVSEVVHGMKLGGTDIIAQCTSLPWGTEIILSLSKERDSWGPLADRWCRHAHAWMNSWIHHHNWLIMWVCSFVYLSIMKHLWAYNYRDVWKVKATICDWNYMIAIISLTFQTKDSGWSFHN